MIPPKNTEKTISHEIFFGEYVKISRFHHIPGSCTHSAYFSKIFWFHYDLLMIFHFVKIMDRWELFNEKTPKTRLDAKICWGQFLKYYTKIWGLIGPKNVKNLEFQKVELWKDNDFLKWFPIFSCIFCRKIAMKRRGQDP